MTFRAFAVCRPTAMPAMLFAASLLALAGCSRSEGGAASGSAAAPSSAAAAKEVGVVTVGRERLAVHSELPGRTSALLVAEIRPQVGGIVQKRVFTEGAAVKAGEVLYQLDPSTYQAAVASAEASVRRAESAVAAARTVAARNVELVKIDAVSQQVNDESQAALAQAEADLGVVRAAEQTARINLAFTRITAPIAGRTSLSTVTPGALVTANQATAMTTVQQLDPIHVDVTQSSADLLQLKQELASGRLKRAGSGSGEAPIRLVLENGSVYPHEGRLTFSGVNVDSGTGAVTLRAVVPNPEGLLMPGMYVRARLEEAVDEEAILVPQQSVVRAPNGATTALVVDPGDKVVVRRLVVDRAIGNRWQVTSGLVAGERVIVEGSQKVKAGDTVHAVALAVGAASGAGSASAPSAPAQP